MLITASLTLTHEETPMITTKSRWLVAAVAAASLAGVTGVASATTPPAEMTGPSGALCAAVPAEGPGSAAAMAAEPLATAASSNPLLATLVAAVTAGGLVDTLNGPGPFTVIAPINSAFDKVNPDTLKGLLADKDALGKVLTYHVIGKQMSGAELVAAAEVDTVNGAKLTFSKVNDTIVINGGAAAVQCGDIKVGNATVFLIDSVVLPPS